MATIEDAFRRRGFPAAHVQASTDISRAEGTASPAPVTIEITISEGARTMVGSVSLAGNAAVAESQLRPIMKLQPGAPFFAPQLGADRDALAQLYANLGYQTASIEAAANYSADRTRVDPVFTVREGPRIFVDHVLILGNVRTRTARSSGRSADQARRPAEHSAVNEANRASPRSGCSGGPGSTSSGTARKPARPARHRRGSAATTVGYGGGFEVQQIVSTCRRVRRRRTARVRAARVRSRSGGGTCSARTARSTFFTRASPNSAAEGRCGRAFGFTEYRVIGTFREPRAVRHRAPTRRSPPPSSSIRTSFNFDEQELHRRAVPAASPAGQRQRQLSDPENEDVRRALRLDAHASDRPPVPACVALVILGSIIARLARATCSTRDMASISAGTRKSPGARIGSEVGLAKTFFTAQTFHPVPREAASCSRANARVGRRRPAFRASIDPLGHRRSRPPAERTVLCRRRHDVRGFALDTVGVRHTPAQPEDTIDQNGFPKGGNAVVIMNAELRAPLRGGLGRRRLRRHRERVRARCRHRPGGAPNSGGLRPALQVARRPASIRPRVQASPRGYQSRTAGPARAPDGLPHQPGAGVLRRCRMPGAGGRGCRVQVPGAACGVRWCCVAGAGCRARRACWR